jgi:hypothetical protein
MAELSTDDRLAIQDLYARYSVTVDSGNDEGWVQTFTSDGAFIGANPAYGHDGLRAFRTERRAAAGSLDHYDAQHWNNNLLLTDRGDHVEGICYLVRIGKRRSDDSIVFLSQGCYRDIIVRTDDGWRFARREVLPSADKLPADLVTGKAD